MSDQKPKGLNYLLVIIFVLTFIFVNKLTHVEPNFDLGISAELKLQPIELAALSRFKIGYIIVPYDEYTGQAAASPYDEVYNEYDRCLLELFEKRAALKQIKAQYKMSLKCENSNI